MSVEVPVQLRDQNNVRTFLGVNGAPEQLCACTSHFVLLHDVPWPQMKALVEEYAVAHDKAMLDFFLRPSEVVIRGRGDGNRQFAKELKAKNLQSPEALSIHNQSRRRGFVGLSGTYCRTPALKKALHDIGLLEEYEQRELTITPAWHIVFESYELQRRAAQLMIENHIGEMDWAVPSSNLDVVASRRVVELLEKSSSTLDFLGRVCAPLVKWFDNPVRKGVKGANTRRVRRPWTLVWFAIWLVERGILLFPLTAFQRGTDILPIKYRHFMESWIRTPDSRAKFTSLYEAFSQIVSEQVIRRNRAQLLLVTISLVSPTTIYTRPCAECLGYLKDCETLSSEEGYYIATLWKIEAARLKKEGIDPQVLQAKADLVIQVKTNADVENLLWDWVDNSKATIPLGSRFHRANSPCGPNLRSHVSDLRRIFPRIAGKSAKQIKSKLAVWLTFLASIEDQYVPAQLTKLEPRLLDSKRDEETFQNFLDRLQISARTQNRIFAVLKRAWREAALDFANDDLLCPVSDHLIAKKRGQPNRPSSSTRRAIDMTILELLIDENRANDFAFNRNLKDRNASRPRYERLVVDPESGKMVYEWWPGLAVLMDVLLQIPLRHKQARYLDSGEGDEFVLNTSTLELSPNPLSTAECKRNQAFVQRISLSPLHDEPGLGMYVNTNKTGRDYHFPWLMRDIADNVQRVVAWQMKFNPIASAISDRSEDQTLADREANIEPVWVYPVFRDPDRHDHVPISTGIVRDYFRALLKHVEQKYNEQGHTSISFFRPDGEPIYDIHALRVTGVTRLLSLGVDPKIVRMLVGHASLTMMFYYEHISNERVSSALEKAFELRRPDRESLLKMNVAERTHFFSRLFNRSEQPTLAISLLRDAVDERSPFVDFRIDGICPGQSCAAAGVWRTNACSLCKYFVTGAPFLAGLELTLNNLMAEIILNQQKIAELRSAFYEKQLNGASTRSIEAEIVKREEFVDHVIEQWEAQFQYVKKAEASLRQWMNDRGPVVPNQALEINFMSPDADKIGLALQETHHLTLFTRLVEGAKRVDGFLPTIGVRETRDTMLLEIARHEKKTELFYKLDPKLRRLALDHFALLLMDQDLPPDDMCDLIAGNVPLSSIPTASQWLEQLGSETLRELLPSEGAQ